MHPNEFAKKIQEIQTKKDWVDTPSPVSPNEQVVGEMDDYEKSIYSFIQKNTEKMIEAAIIFKKENIEGFKNITYTENVSEKLEQIVSLCKDVIFAWDILEGLIYLRLKIDFSEEIDFRKDFQIVLLEKNIFRENEAKFIGPYSEN